MTPEKKMQEMQNQAADKIIFETKLRDERLDTGSDCMNQFLNGGYESDIITTIYGEGGSGKTNLCLLALISTIKKGKKVIYIDTEGNFSIARLKQLTENYEEILESVLLMKITDFEQQTKILSRMKEIITKDIGLVIIDSIATLYRLQRADNPDEAIETNKILGKQLFELAKIARTKNIPILVTNQVWQSFEDSSQRMVGGNLLINSSKCIIELRKFKAGRRGSILKKHRSMPEGKEMMFEIISKGIKHLKDMQN